MLNKRAKKELYYQYLKLAQPISNRINSEIIQLFILSWSIFDVIGLCFNEEGVLMKIGHSVKSEIEERLCEIGFEQKQVQDVLEVLQKVMIDHDFNRKYKEIRQDSFECMIDKALTRVIFSALRKIIHAAVMLIGVTTILMFFH